MLPEQALRKKYDDWMEERHRGWLKMTEAARERLYAKWATERRTELEAMFAEEGKDDRGFDPLIEGTRTDSVCMVGGKHGEAELGYLVLRDPFGPLAYDVNGTLVGEFGTYGGAARALRRLAERKGG